MPRVASPPLGVWSVEGNNALVETLGGSATLASVAEGITPISGCFRRDLLAFYKAARLVPHPQLLPFHPDEEDPSTNGELLLPGGEKGAPGVVFDLAEIDTLAVKNWELDEGSFAGLCFALQHCNKIHTVIFFNAQLRVDQVETLFRLLPQTSVTRFHLDWNAHSDTETAPQLPASLFTELLAPSSNISTLSLRRCGLTTEHAVAIAQALRANSTLELLNLFDNPQVGDDGALELAYALPFNTSLRSLSLGNTALSGKAARVLLEVACPKYAAPPALLKVLEDAEPRIQAELDQAKKAKKKLDRATVIQTLGLPVLETIDGVQYAAGNTTLQDLVLSGNDLIEEHDVLAMNELVAKHHAELQVTRIKLQRIASLKPLASHGHHPPPHAVFQL